MYKLPARKRIFTTDPAQLRVLFFLLIAILVPVLFVGSFLYLTVFKILSEQPSMPGFMLSTRDPVIIKMNHAIMFGLLPLLLLLLAWGIILSHRFIGPLQRLQRELDEVSETKDLKKRLGVRKNDYVKPLVNSINKLLDKLAK